MISDRRGKWWEVPPPKPLRASPRLRFVGVRTGKMILAAVLAYVLAPLVSTAAVPILAPLTALLVVQVTLYESFTSGLRRVLAVAAGVTVAAGIALAVPLTWWSLGAAVAVGLVLGRVLRLGDAALEVPISAMLILAVGGSRGPAFDRIYETLLGAAVGVLVHLVVAPPLYVRPAGDAVAAVADKAAALLDDVAEQVARGYTLEEAQRWLDRARALGRPVTAADAALRRAEASLRLNPRQLTHRVNGATLRTGLDALERASVSMRGVFRAMADRARGPNDEPLYGDDVREALSRLFTDLAHAVRAFGREVDDEITNTRADDRELRASLQRCWAERNDLARRLHDGERPDSIAWELHGELLANIDRLLREVDAEGRAQLRESIAERTPHFSAPTVVPTPLRKFAERPFTSARSPSAAVPEPPARPRRPGRPAPPPAARSARSPERVMTPHPRSTVRDHRR